MPDKRFFRLKVPKICLSTKILAARFCMDKVDFFRKVREGYLRLAEQFDTNFLIINAEEDLKQNLQRICTWLKVDNSK